MKLVVELNAEQYALVESGEVTHLAAPLTEVEIRQEDSLLSLERDVRFAERLGVAMAHDLGVGRDDAPTIRVWMREQGAVDGDED